MTTLCPPGDISRIEANRTIKEALEAAVAAGRARQRISVTDLINPMQSFFQRTRPDIEMPLERLQLMWTGTGFHRLFGAAVSSEEFLEQFLEKDGVVGKVDIYEDIPIELKTSASLPEDLVAERPAYVDQLGLYCHMASNPEGAVIVYRREEFGRDPGLRVYRVSFHDLDNIGKRMIERRDLLVDALERQDASKLGQCDWWQRSCLYQEICPCGTAQVTDRVVDPVSVSVVEDPGMSQELMEAASQFRSRPTWAITFNDLVFPRRGVLLRTVGPKEEDDEDRLAQMQRSGLFLALTEAMRYGEPDAYAGVSVALGNVRGVVRSYRGLPTIIRTTGTYQMIERDHLPDERPYWLDRLALETAVTGQQAGRLVVYYPRLPGGEKFMVYDIGFRDLDATLAEARSRIALFESKPAPEAFPECGPDWMARYCPFGDNCACKV